MRAFLREPSTPWIVFDQEGRPPSQLAVGEVLPTAFSSVFPENGFFPSTNIIDAIPQSKVEPSSLAVASDLTEETDVAIADPELTEQPLLPVRRSRRLLGAAAAAVAIVSTIAIGGFALRAASQPADSAPGSAAAQPPAQATGAQAKQVAPEPAPPELAPSPAPAPNAPNTGAGPANAPAPPAGAPAAPVTGTAGNTDESPAKAAAKKWARLSVAGGAVSRDVFLDNKRMLGKGPRSYTISCGPHTLAVGSRTDVRDIDLPCTGTYELVVTK